MKILSCAVFFTVFFYFSRLIYGMDENHPNSHKNELLVLISNGKEKKEYSITPQQMHSLEDHQLVVKCNLLNITCDDIFNKLLNPILNPRIKKIKGINYLYADLSNCHSALFKCTGLPKSNESNVQTNLAANKDISAGIVAETLLERAKRFGDNLKKKNASPKQITFLYGQEGKKETELYLKDGESYKIASNFTVDEKLCAVFANMFPKKDQGGLPKIFNGKDYEKEILTRSKHELYKRATIFLGLTTCVFGYLALKNS